MATKNRKVVRYRKSLNINIGTIIFGITFLYILINVFLYFSRDRITFFEVVEGKSANTANKSYTGLILRQESVTKAEKTGYIHYYVPDCARISVGSSLYTLDESDVVAQLLEENQQENTTLTKDDLEIIKENISAFKTEFRETDFDLVYEFKNQLDNKVAECVNLNALEDLRKILADKNQELSFQIEKSKSSGIVVYTIDGYESLKLEDVEEEDFNKNAYQPVLHTSNELLEKDTPIYKTITDETWNILIKLSKEEVKKYQEDTILKIRFLKDDITVNADFEIVNLADGSYGKFTLSRFLSRYAKDRFLEIRIIEDEVSGLKVPKSAVVEKEFYKVPIDYLTNGGNQDNSGFNVERKTQKGESSVVFVTPTLYDEDDEYYYIDDSTISPGETIVKNDSNERYTIGESKPLKGVYNINAGYAMFRRIEILTESNGYYIIEPKTDYGVVIYDHIVLDGSMVKENQVIFQ